MIWLTWRQFRVQAIAGAASLAALAIAFVATGPQLAALYDASGLATCRGHAHCGALADSFINQLNAGHTYPVLYLIATIAILIAPAIIGVFWGAPLIAREIEAGTYRLAWSQSVTRNRWLAVKLGLICLAAMAAAELLGLMQTWWAAPIGRAAGLAGTASLLSSGSLNPIVFATHGVTPLGYAAFTFALGAAAGVLTRRVVPAMAITLAVFAVIQIAMPLWIRPHLIPPRHAVLPLTSVNLQALGSSDNKPIVGVARMNFEPDAWIISSGPVDVSGRVATTVPPTCQRASGIEGFLDCLTSHGIRAGVTYQPASRYWAFQGIETGIFIVLAGGLAGFCSWQVSRRRLA
jgi:ABC-2 family transporter protein